MINIRRNLFETNSSSVHSLVIPKNQDIKIPRKRSLFYRDYGWEAGGTYDTLSYIYTACKDRGDEYVERFIEYLTDKGIEVTEYHSSNMFGIDHSDEVPLDDLFNNTELFDRLLFGVKSFIQTGNDNTDECPDPNNYFDCDVLMKYN